MPLLVKQSTTNLPLLFFLTSSSDHIAGLTGKSATVAVKISKNGATGVTPAGAISEIDATNNPGWYAVAGNATDTNALGPIILSATVTGADPCDMIVAQVVSFDPTVANIGLSNVSSNVAQWNGSNVSAPATAGIPEVNIKNINNVAATAVTAVAANIGTAQPVNFTGTAGTALVKSDTVDIAGAAVSATTAQLGVNAVQINGVATTAVTTVNANQGTTQPVNFTGTAASALVKGDAIDINSIAATAVTTIAANIGTTQPLNFTGTAASALVKGDTVDIAGAAVSTTAAQIGVNAVQINTVPTTSVTTVNANQGTTQPVNFTGAAASALVKGDAIDINSVAATAVSAINANLGTTQPVNFTGTAGAALVKSDAVDIAGAAVSASAAQLGVNVVNIAGAAAAIDGNNLLKVDIEAINASTGAAQNVSKANQSIGRGTCAAGGNVSTIPTSAFAPGGAGIVAGQFIGRTIVFDATTATPALQGQASNITANTSGATPSFSVSPMTTAPGAGDTFGVY